jgi:signal transduction histidine kinase/DNA-binding response OmpR family regulator
MSGKKVLIVEDDAIISNFIQIKLEEVGYQIPAKARCATEAIEMARRFLPDLILMDVMLEGEIDGIQAVEEITKELDIPVIYLTASSDEKTINRLMKTEPHGFLIKPFDDRILYSAIQIAVYRHKTKQELFKTKEMLRTTMQSIEDMVFSVSTRGEFTHSHSGDKHRLEIFKEKNIVGKSFKDVFPANVAKKLFESVQWVMDYKKPSSVEFSLAHNDNQYWFISKMTLCIKSNGCNSGVTMVISDVTDNKNMYRELLVSQQKLSEAQNIAKLGSSDVFFKEKKFVYNDLYFKILDIEDQQSIREFSDDMLFKIMHPDDRSRYQLFKRQIFEEKRSEFSIDYRIIDRKGEQRYIHSMGQLSFDSNGQPVRMINTLQDITSQKTNEKLRQDVEVATKTSQMKQRLFARLSHEIRNPVSGIVGLLHLLENTDLDDKQSDYIQALKTSSNTLLHLLNDVLDYTKIEAGMMKINPADFSLKTTIKNIYTFFIPQSLEKNVDFTYRISDDFPERILADESKIVQVISNFLSNAFKYTQRGKIELRLTYQKGSQEDEGIIIRIEVEDTGMGVETKYQDELFSDYNQLNIPHDGRVKGTGLGLSICRQLVTMMGGEIGMVSEGKDKGSMFWFSLPVIATILKPVVSKSKPVSAREKLNCSVLLVEDMIVNQKVIKLLLEEMGCKVAIASNGVQAIEMFKETEVNAFDIFARINYDIILMDHIMPVMDGLTAFRKMKQDFQNIPPVIVLTADESFAQNDSYREKGFNDCIIKPVYASVLYDKIQLHIKQSKSKVPSEKVELFSIEDIDSKPVINSQTLSLILKQAENNNFNVNILFESFIEDMERIYVQSLSAVEMDDINSLRLIVMTVKGLSGGIGASQIHATARLMDRYIRNEEYEEAKSLLPLLAEKYAIFKDKIEDDYLKRAAN